MTRQITLFSLMGFKIRLHASWILLALLVGWSLAVGYFPQIQEGLSASTYWVMGFLGVIGLFFSIVFHEFFHSVVARHYEMPMRGITLFIFGGIAEMADEPPSPKAEGLMAIAGPISSLVLWLAFALVAGFGMQLQWPAPALAVLVYLSQINLILAIFNMIPAFPLDGGRVLRAILWSAKGNMRWATNWSSRIGIGFGLALALLGVVTLFQGAIIGGIWWILIGLFLSHIAGLSYSQLIIKETLKDETTERFIKESPQLTVLNRNLNLNTAIDNYFYKYNQRSFPVVENDKLIGCLSVDDIRSVPKNEREHSRVGSVLHSCSADETISPKANAFEALKKMNQTGKNELLVVEGETLLGTLRKSDLLDRLSMKLEIEEGRRNVV